MVRVTSTPIGASEAVAQPPHPRRIEPVEEPTRRQPKVHVHVQESGEPLELRPSDGVGQCAQPHLALERALRRPLSGDGHGSPLLKLLQHVPHDGAEHAIPVACKCVAAVRLAVRAHCAHQPQAAEVVGALRDQDDAREVPT